MHDLRKSVARLYEFLKSFNYLEATTKIQSTLYHEALKYLPNKNSKAESNIELQAISTADSAS